MGTRFCTFCGFRRHLTGDAFQDHLIWHVRRGEAVTMIQGRLKVVVKPEQVAKYKAEGWVELPKPGELQL